MIVRVGTEAYQRNAAGEWECVGEWEHVTGDNMCETDVWVSDPQHEDRQAQHSPEFEAWARPAMWFPNCNEEIRGMVIPPVPATQTVRVYEFGRATTRETDGWDQHLICNVNEVSGCIVNGASLWRKYDWNHEAWINRIWYAPEGSDNKAA